MIIEVKIPSPGESITEVELANWLVEDGDYVQMDQEIAEIESDKATLPLIAEKPGKIKILVKTGETVKVGTVACTIDTSVKGDTVKKSQDKAKSETKADIAEKDKVRDMALQTETQIESTVSKRVKSTGVSENAAEKKKNTRGIKITPLARKMMDEHNLNPEDIIIGLKKISKKEVNLLLEQQKKASTDSGKRPVTREIKREAMSQLRKKLGRRLVAVSNQTAMLTTFNEVDMSEVMRLRKVYQKPFTETHGVKLGFMSFFVKAATEALIAFPKVNSMIDEDEIIMPQYVDISIAVQTEKGLMVPVLRNTEAMTLADIEKQIVVLAEKARNFRLSIEEMSGGTFSITNGGVFGSMLSTPVLNPPQSAILGMHNIVERPVAIEGRVEIRPVMYVALSYDHRLIDGKDSVSFLVRIKELLESPRKMLYGGQDPERVLLGI